MIREVDYIEFAKLLALLNDMSNDTKNITEETIEGYFQVLQDMEIETLKQNGFITIRTTGRFPSVPQLRGKFDKDNSDEAQEAYAFLEKVVISRGHQNIELIKESCTRNGWEHLIPYLDQWAPEIGTTDNVIATRAQFINQYKAIRRRGEIKLLKNESHAALPENIQKQIGEIG